MKLTVPQLVAHLENHPAKGAKICTVITRTHPEMVKKHRATGEPNPYLAGELVRIAHRRIILGAHYEGLVNRQREREGSVPDFKAEALWKGHGHKHGAYTVYNDNSGKVYFAYLPEVGEPEHLPEVIRDGWYFNGQPLTEAQLADLPNVLKAQGDAKKQELDKQVFWRTLDLENLVALSYGGVIDIDHSIPATIEHCPAEAR